jgi:hypothetical protein
VGWQLLKCQIRTIVKTGSDFSNIHYL